MGQIFFLPGPRDNALSGRLPLMRSGVTRGHHVLNVINHRVAGRWHDNLKIRQSLVSKAVLETASPVSEI